MIIHLPQFEEKSLRLYKSRLGRCPSSVNLIHPARRATFARAPVSTSLVLALCLVSLALGAEKDNETSLADRKADPRLLKYFVTKEREARALAKQLNLQVEPEVWEYFATGATGDCTGADRLYNQITRSWREQQKGSPVSGPMMEAELACEGFSGMEAKHVEAFARDVIDSIPRGSIYFGGTDPGRGLVTAFVKSLPEADPFFVLSQNPFASRPYLEWVRAVYEKKISLPTTNDLKQAFEDYSTDVTARMKEGKLKPGEKVEEDEEGKMTPASTAAWMEVNALLAKMVFDRNPRHEFYVEESFPIDWMYPHLSPHGLILKLNRKPLAALSPKMVEDDRRYWRAQTKRLLGDWLAPETPTRVLCEFLENVYGQMDLEEFKGDKDYVMALRGRNAQFLYAHLRLAQAHVYEWRKERATTPEEKERMVRELDLVYRQVIALSPTNVETVKRYVNLLRDQERLDDARRMLKTGRMLNPRSTRLQALDEELN